MNLDEEQTLPRRMPSVKLVTGVLFFLLAVSVVGATDPADSAMPSPEELLKEIQLLREIVEQLAEERDEEIEQLTEIGALN